MSTFEQDETPLDKLPKDVVTSTEYEEAYQGISRFTRVDLNELRTLEDLSARASLIGQHISRVITSQGEVRYVTTFSDQGIEESMSYILIKDINNKSLMATSKEEEIQLRKYDDKTRTISFAAPGFNIKLPLSNDLVMSTPKQVEAVRVREKQTTREEETKLEMELGLLARGFKPLIYAGYARAFNPVQYSRDPEVQRQFAGLLQEYLGDLLQVIPKPAQVPQVFNF